jgi:membrane protein YqaA with SNARE-associated domain
MNPGIALAAATPGVGRRLVAWLLRLGGIGLIPLGLLDNSVVPVPGSMDALTVLLAAQQRQLWWYYALMATLGSVIGGYATYQLGRKEGQEAIARRFSQTRMDRIHAQFERWGYGAVAIPAMLPPPMPMVPFLLAAGAAQYPRTKFVLALIVGRGIRYTALAFLASRYGRRILRQISGFGHPVLFAVIVVAIVISGLVFVFVGRRKPARRAA